MTEEMSVHEALCEIKVADKKIKKLIEGSCFCAVAKQCNTKINGIDISAFAEQSKSSHQKITDLIRRTEAIKRAVSLSNASTRISVSGKEMSVAEAIYEFQHGLDSKRELLEAMQKQLAAGKNNVNYENNSLEKKREAYIAQLYSGKDAKLEDIRSSEDDYTQKNTAYLVDPLNLEEKINALQEEIDSFASHVDSALQMSNAVTKITIEY